MQSYFSVTDVADEKISQLSPLKSVLYPFISIQKDFGYSDVTLSNHDVENKIDCMFKSTQLRLQNSLSIIEPKSQLEILLARGLKLGQNHNIARDCQIDDAYCWHIEIGNNVTIESRVAILAHDNSTSMHLGYTEIKSVIIGDNVFIGSGSLILPGVKVGNNVIISAGSIVSCDIPENSYCSGNPAIPVSSIVEYINRKKEQIEINNCFSADFTLKNNLSIQKKEQVIDAVKNSGSASSPVIFWYNPKVGLYWMNCPYSGREVTRYFKSRIKRQMNWPNCFKKCSTRLRPATCISMT